MTDMDAQSQLPCQALILQQYRVYRREGYKPADALRLTLTTWKEISRSIALVPHRPHCR